MAQAVRREFGVDLGIAVSGVAGPDGGTAEKPVGTVHVALAGPGAEVAHRRLRLPGDRGRIRWLATQVALELLRRRLLKIAREGAA
jgi:nicotinamide-nucleotide amidase